MSKTCHDITEPIKKEEKSGLNKYELTHFDKKEEQIDKIPCLRSMYDIWTMAAKRTSRENNVTSFCDSPPIK